MSLRFGEFALDSGTRQLRRGEEERHLGPKAFELLELLLERRPNVVTKEAIHDRLWPGTFVSGSTLATVIGEIRSALEDEAGSPRFLRTVHGVGYAFCGDAREEEASPAAGGSSLAGTGGPTARLSYRLLFDDREIALRPGENLLGRVEDGVLWIESPSVSRRHARIRLEGGRAVLEDLGSKNGTFWRGERVTSPVTLSDGDEIHLGKVGLTLRILPADAATLTDRS